MDIALLNVKITLQKNEVVTDAIRNHKNSWIDFYSCYATAGGESKGEADSAGTINDNTDMDFTLRWCRNTANITTDGHRVIFNGEIYNILGIDHMNFKKKCVKLRCRKVKR